MSPATRVLILIPSLVAHGAERQLCELVRHIDHGRFEVHVVVFYSADQHAGSDLSGDLADLPGVFLHSLRKRRGALGYLAALPRLYALVRRLQPHVLHGYMDGNMPVLLMGALFRRPVIWGIRRSSSDISKLSRLSIWLGALSCRLSRFADLIIFNSEAGRDSHARRGMTGKRACVIPNGFDVDKFHPAPEQGHRMRQSWGVQEGVPLIGIVGRLAPVKDHPTFLHAMAKVADEWPDATFICLGDGPQDYLDQLRGLAESLGIGDRTLWPGPCSQMPAAYSALSVLVLSSTDEGFPNVIGEAMACGVPCITTPVGDAARLAGDVGIVVPRGDGDAIAAAVTTLLRESPEGRRARSESARRRVCELFSAPALARSTEEAILSALAAPVSRTIR